MAKLITNKNNESINISLNRPKCWSSFNLAVITIVLALVKKITALIVTIELKKVIGEDINDRHL